jgi:hypothetical protein
MDFACKESTKDAVGRLKEAIFWSIPRSFPLMQTSAIYFDARICAHAANAFLQNIRGASKFADFKTEDAFGGPNTILLPILRFPRFRAHDARAFTQRGAQRTRWKEPAQDVSVTLKNAFFRLFLRFSACEPMRWQPVQPADSCTRCTRLPTRQGAEPKSTDLKNRPKMPFGGFKRPSFAYSWLFPHNADVNNLFDTDAAQA